MATTRQKTAARRNIKKARTAQSRGARGKSVARSPSRGLSTRQQNRLRTTTFAFPNERKEPLNDARHVRNAIARFDQVEGVSDAERDAAWRRIRTAARKFGVEVSARGWRQLLSGGKTGRASARRTTSRSSRSSGRSTRTTTRRTATRSRR